jgi:hypothetical protein
MKLFKLLPIAAAFVAAPSFAAGPQAGDVVIYAAGASAQLNTLSNIVSKLCKPNVTGLNANNIEFYQGFNLANTANTNLRAYRCSVIDGIGLDGKKVVFAYSAIGGSASGVQYVARQLPRTFLKFSSCPTTGVLSSSAATPANSTQFNCNVGTTLAALQETQVPVAGSSDVEPSVFVGDNVPLGETGMTGDDIAKLDVRNSRAIIFGIAANEEMVLALQRKAARAAGTALPTVADMSAAARPSIAKWEYRTIAGGGYFNGIAGLAPGETAGPLQIARRVNGSGTQAISNITFLNNPCGRDSSPTAAISPAKAGDSDPAGTVITEGSATSDVVTAIRNATIPAIGVISLENPEVTTATNAIVFLKLDGVIPSRANAISGAYDFYAEETFQWNKAATNDDQKAFLDAFVSRAGEISTLQTLTAQNQLGNAALPAFNGGVPSADPTWILKAERGGVNCKPAVRIVE